LSAGTEVRVHRALGKIHTLGGVVVKIRKRRGVYLYDVRYFEGASKVARSVEKRVAPDRIVVVDEEDIAGSDSGAGSDNPRNDSRMWLQRMCDGSIPVPFDGLELDAFITHNPCGQSYVMRGSFAGNNPLLGRQRQRQRQPVAAKVFLDGREYQRELTVMRRLQSDANLGGGHRNVVATIHEFQHPCAVLLFELGSMSLKDAFDLDVTTGVMQERRRMVASYGLDAARGMAFLHESGIAHLDLKPDNVMIFGKGGGRGDDHAKIIDLGLAEAHAAGRDDAEVLVQGTVPYMSPEVHRARRQPVRTDLFKVDAWAMGCVLWATAAGLDPWREMVPDDDGGGVPDDERKAAYQLRVGDAVVGGATPPVDIPDVPSELRPLLASAFQMEAAARPSMGAFVEFLSAFAAAAGSRDGGGGGGGGEAGGGEGLSAPLLG
jgi:serine/threonine protein kinase